MHRAPDVGSVIPASVRITDERQIRFLGDLASEAKQKQILLPVTAPRLAALDQLKRVIYIGSFSKTLPGSVRVGYIAAAPELAENLNEMKVITIVSTSAQNEQLVYTLMEGAHYLKYLRRLRERIEDATARTVRALESAGISVPRSLSGGLYVWTAFNEAMKQRDIVAGTANAGIFIAPPEAFSPSARSTDSLRINVAYGSDARFMEWLQVMHDRVAPR
jgi:DNA-binding transcriptional MocR family regulator